MVGDQLLQKRQIRWQLPVKLWLLISSQEGLDECKTCRTYEMPKIRSLAWSTGHWRLIPYINYHKLLVIITSKTRTKVITRNLKRM